MQCALSFLFTTIITDLTSTTNMTNENGHRSNGGSQQKPSNIDLVGGPFAVVESDPGQYIPSGVYAE